MIRRTPSPRAGAGEPDDIEMLGLELRAASLGRQAREAACRRLFETGSVPAIRHLVSALDEPELEPLVCPWIERYLDRYYDLSRGDLIRLLRGDAKVSRIAAARLQDLEWRPETAEERAWFLVALERYWDAAREGAVALPALLKRLDRSVAAVGTVRDRSAIAALLANRPGAPGAAPCSPCLWARSVRRFLLSAADLIDTGDLQRLAHLEDLDQSGYFRPGVAPAGPVDGSAIRYLAARELSRRGLDNGCPLEVADTGELIAHLDSPDIRRRHAAIRSIGDRGVDSALPQLLARYESAIEDESPIAHTLGLLGNPAAIGHLLRRIEKGGGDIEPSVEALSLLVNESIRTIDIEPLRAVMDLPNPTHSESVGGVVYSWEVPIADVKNRAAEELRRREMRNL
jgi:hypothetical protein